MPSRGVETNNSLGRPTKQNSIPFCSCHLTGTWACCRKNRHKKCELSTVCMRVCMCVFLNSFLQEYFSTFFTYQPKKTTFLQSYPSPLPYPHSQKLVISFDTLPFIVHSQCHSKSVKKKTKQTTAAR